MNFGANATDFNVIDAYWMKTDLNVVELGVDRLPGELLDLPLLGDGPGRRRPLLPPPLPALRRGLVRRQRRQHRRHCRCGDCGNEIE